MAIDSAAWLDEQIGAITDHLEDLSPSEWAEANRRLPQSVTALPGPYDYSVAPYLVEIVNCLDTRSPIRRLAMMKGAQTCGTVGVGENGLGYFMAHVKTAPCMMVTADAELAKLRMEENVTPMIAESGLSDLIQSNTGNSRKAGQTDLKVSWVGGGYLVPLGAKNAAKLRSVSVRYLFLDEVDAYPLRVGKDGDPIKLAIARTKGFEKTRKILEISTPTTEQESRILADYMAGDQRKFKVPCLGCGVRQELRWRVVDPEDATIQTGGIVWERVNGRVKPGSVRYKCPHCGHLHRNDDKVRMLPAGVWEPTAEPQHPTYRSYHVSGLMSPAEMYSWESAAVEWEEAWDVVNNRIKDVEKLQEFYNNVLGQAYRLGGSKLKLSTVSYHRRIEYDWKQVPNKFAAEFGGGEIQLLTCAIDVQKNFLAYSVTGWGRGRRSYLIDYRILEGNVEDEEDSATWGELEKLIADEVYRDENGRQYRPAITLIDSRYLTDQTYSFCQRFQGGVFPIKGDHRPSKGATKEWHETEVSRAGLQGFTLYVNHYKTKLAATLKQKWARDGSELPIGAWNAPASITDKQLKELTEEEFREVTSKTTGLKSWTWDRRPNSRNELWDLSVYNRAALDIIAFMVMREHFELEAVNWTEFWQFAENEGAWYTDP